MCIRDRLLTWWGAHVERRIEALGRRTSRGAKLRGRALTVPALVGSGVRGAIEIVRSRDPLALGAIAWWGFDIATLWACLLYTSRCV